ncbi:MAG: aspartate kinase [Acidobacteriota bacterium]
MRVLKFGGSSLDGPERLANVAELVCQARESGRIVVVVSALAGVTDALEAAIERAVAGDPATPLVERLATRHLECLASPQADEAHRDTEDQLAAALQRLRRLLEGIRLVGECPCSTRDQILATGERLSAPLVNWHLRRQGRAAQVIDGSRLIATGPPGRASVDPAETCRRVERRLRNVGADEIPVVTGFIGSDSVGQTTTLGRGASDFSATLLAMALGAEEVEIWTDVDGVLSADPRWVPSASTLPHLTYGEATDLACYGARVLHPQTLDPLVRSGIPATIRNSLAPDRSGTRIDAGDPRESTTRAITAMARVVRFRLRIPDGSVEPAHLSMFRELDEPPLISSWETPGRTLTWVTRAEHSELTERLARRHGLDVIQREALALITILGGPQVDLPLLRALSEGSLPFQDLSWSGATSLAKTLLVERSVLRSAVRWLHHALVENPVDHPPIGGLFESGSAVESTDAGVPQAHALSSSS